MLDVFIAFFLFNDPTTTGIYTLSLHDALPISAGSTWMHRQQLRRSLWTRNRSRSKRRRCSGPRAELHSTERQFHCQRSEEHTSELQSLTNLVCRLLLEKKKNNTSIISS